MRLGWIGATAALALLMSCGAQEKATSFHWGEWEKDIGYSKSVRIEHRILVSGTVGDETHTDFPAQMRDVYEALRETLAHDGASLKNVVKETIYTTDMAALMDAQNQRKAYYLGNLPASTWVQVERLYSPGHLIEVEVEAWVP